MLKCVACRVFAALLIASVIGVDHATAGMPGEVAHSAMGGSTLMRTTAQFNAWTHWLVDYDNFVELNVDPVRSSGQAALHWKYNDNNHLIFRVRQYDLGGQNSGFLFGGTLCNPRQYPADIIDNMGVFGYNAYRTGQMLNLAWARSAGDGGAFSVGLLFASAGEKMEHSAQTDDWDDASTAVGGQVTWGNGEKLDVAASFFSESSTHGAEATEDESDFTHFDLTARYQVDDDWVFQFGGRMGSGTISMYDSAQRDISLMDITGILGRHLYDAHDAAVTAEFYVSYLSGKHEVGTTESTNNELVVPGTRVACWSQISRRFQIMAGANAFWSMGKDESEYDSTKARVTETESTRGMQFSYSAGLAYVPNDRLRIEGQLEMDHLNYLLSLGNQTPLLVRVGGTFVF